MELHDDDKPIGRVLTRREILKLFGGAGVGLIAGAGFVRMVAAQTGTATPTATAVPTCVVKPALTEGPYFVDEMLNRSDIRIDPTDDSVQEGILLKLIYHVTNVTGGICEPLEGVQVDVWHCNAEGSYSDVDDPGFSTEGQKWLRGYQVTDEMGMAEFITIYPGWYSGRTTHIHFKIRTDPESDTGYEFTSQLFFDEDLTDIVHAQEPYAAKGYRDTLNEDDSIFQESEGLLTLDAIENPDEEEGGYVANFYIGLDLDAETTEVSSGGGSQGGGPQGGGPGGGNPPGGRP